MGTQGKLIDLAGQRFGRWVVIERAPDDKHGNRRWICRCDCGTTKEVAGTTLKTGQSTSCGCYMSEKAKITETTHGLRDSPFWLRYYHAKRRCEDPNNEAYANYGGRGIKFLFTSIEEYAACLGPPPSPQHQVDRIDNDGHYEPGNVKWSTRSEQVKNRRPISRWGLSLTKKEFERLHIKGDDGNFYPMTLEGLKEYRSKHNNP